MTQSNRHADMLARVLHGTRSFKGKARLADFLGRIARFSSGSQGAFPLADGKTATIDLGDRIQRLMWGAAYEPHIRRCVIALLRPGDTFVDVGAHIGFFSLIAASVVGETGKVYAFEANSSLFRKLQAGAAPYPWMVPSPQAVWNESGTVYFSDPHRIGESGWGKVTAKRNGEQAAAVPSVSLDDWYEGVGAPPIRLIKIDAEGSEPFILEGARRLIASAQPFMIIELNEELLRKSGQSNRMVVDGLCARGYRIFRMGVKRLEECGGASDPLSPEVLCVPESRWEEAQSALHPSRTKR